jgi:hypothetical protein
VLKNLLPPLQEVVEMDMIVNILVVMEEIITMP